MVSVSVSVSFSILASKNYPVSVSVSNFVLSVISLACILPLGASDRLNVFIVLLGAFSTSYVVAVTV